MKEKKIVEEMKNPWGYLAVINLYGCDSNKIKNSKDINDFVISLCDLIEMKRHGEAIIERFGKESLEGYSMLQFIETSSVTAHFDEIKDRAFIDIFSCKKFNVDKAVNFCFDFFKAQRKKVYVIDRD